MTTPPLLQNKNPNAESVFRPQALLREARRQKRIATVDVPRVCILDPDGDIVRNLRRTGQAQTFDGWPCYHTDLYSFVLGGETAGIIGCAVGAPFGVLVAEVLFACGCKLLLSMTSAGQIMAIESPPYFVIIDRALRDEGCSYHYAAPSEFADADGRLVERAKAALAAAEIKAVVGTTWTTDAPFRETAAAISSAKTRGVLAVEMEAAALYTFARTADVRVLCLAHVTNSMGQVEQDFEKGERDGSAEALRLLEALSRGLRDN
jgi:purine-nucleoside phosphorylase